MSLASSRARLHDATKSLRIAWEHAGDGWRDAHHRQIGDKVLSPLEHATRGAETALDRMEEMLARVQRDCS